MARSLIGGIGGWLIILGIALTLLYSNGAMREKLGEAGNEINELLHKQERLSEQLHSIHTLMHTKERINNDYILATSEMREQVRNVHMDLKEVMANEVFSERNDCRYIPSSIDGLLLKYEQDNSNNSDSVP